MNNSPVSDSPHGLALYPRQNESRLEMLQEPPSSEGSAISPNPQRSTPKDRNVILSSPSDSSPRVAQPFPASPGGHDVKPSSAEGSNGRNSSRPRVSFEDNRTPATNPNHSLRTSVLAHPLLRETSRASRTWSSPAARSTTQGTTSSPKKARHESPSTASHSRATSPIRLFGWSGFHHAQEEPFVPVDPFRMRARLHHLSHHNSDADHHLPFDPENPFCCIPSLNYSLKDHFFASLRGARYFFSDTLPRQIYLILLFYLPSLYFSRIARVYVDAQLSKPDHERMVEAYCDSRLQDQRQRIINTSPILPGARYPPAPTLPFPEEWTATNVSPALVRFKQSWEDFIDSLLREWKTLNLVSALLHTAILSMFQTPVMANDPIIRTAALLSLTSALMSLSYGCIYIIRFGTMRSMYKAARWAEEAARTTTFILWNVWVLLAMPAVWLAWSMIFFIIAILAYVWRYGSSTDPASPQPLSPTAAIGPRVAVSALFFLGLLYFGAIVKTLQNYGISTENRLSRAHMGNGSGDMVEADARGRRRGRSETRSFSRNVNHGPESPERNGDRESTRRKHEQEPASLPAVTGLGLRSLDEFVNPESSDETALGK